MRIPEDLFYTREHEWVRREGAEAIVGVTDYAQSQLGDVVYVDLPAVGARVEAGQSFGTVESVKTVSELYGPVSGEVLAVNAALGDEPQAVNEDPFERGWMLRLRPSDPSQFSALMSSSAYARFVEEGAHD